MALQAEEQEQESGFVPEEKPVGEQPLSAREQRMEEIAARELAKRQEAEGEPPAEVPEPVAAEAPDPEPVAAEPQPQVLTGDFAQYKVRAKIDGEELEVPLDDVLRNYQKNGAADKRLAEATRLLKEAQEVSKKVEPDPQPAPASVADDSVVDEFIESLWESDKDKAKENLRKFMASGRQQPAPTLDTRKIAEEIAPAIKQQLAVENALEQFREANSDIVDDPYLASITERFWSEEIASGKDQVKALKDAGVKTRDWLKSKGIAQKVTATPTVSRDEKLKRKEGIDNLPSTSARATDSGVAAPMTTQDVLAEMRKQRGFEA